MSLFRQKICAGYADDAAANYDYGHFVQTSLFAVIQLAETVFSRFGLWPNLARWKELLSSLLEFLLGTVGGLGVPQLTDLFVRPSTTAAS